MQADAIRTDIFGWFDASGAHDPGLEVPCPVCLRPLREGKRNTIITDITGPGRTNSYFFRVHRHCWKNIDEAEKRDIESTLIDRLTQGDV